MQTKNVVSNNLKEFVLGLEAAVKEGYSVVEESVAFESGFWKVLTKKEEASSLEDFVDELIKEDPSFSDKIESARMTLTVLNSSDALEMLDNHGEPNEKLKEILEFSPVVEVPEGTKMETSEGTVIAQPVVTQKPKRNRK